MEGKQRLERRIQLTIEAMEVCHFQIGEKEIPVQGQDLLVDLDALGKLIELSVSKGQVPEVLHL